MLSHIRLDVIRSSPSLAFTREVSEMAGDLLAGEIECGLSVLKLNLISERPDRAASDEIARMALALYLDGIDLDFKEHA